MLHVQVSFPLQPLFLITTADIFLPFVKCHFRTQDSLFVTLAYRELEINNEISVGAFLIPNSAYDHVVISLIWLMTTWMS